MPSTSDTIWRSNATASSICASSGEDTSELLPKGRDWTDAKTVKPGASFRQIHECSGLGLLARQFLDDQECSEEDRKQYKTLTAPDVLTVSDLVNMHRRANADKMEETVSTAGSEASSIVPTKVWLVKAGDEGEATASRRLVELSVLTNIFDVDVKNAKDTTYTSTETLRSILEDPDEGNEHMKKGYLTKSVGWSSETDHSGFVTEPLHLKSLKMRGQGGSEEEGSASIKLHVKFSPLNSDAASRKKQQKLLRCEVDAAIFTIGEVVDVFKSCAGNLLKVPLEWPQKKESEVKDILLVQKQDPENPSLAATRSKIAHLSTSHTVTIGDGKESDSV